jgi:tRNA A-37 threonylcarbamoyl transferase component Bud32/DNA-binding NarL/FixJ family response regulator
MSTAQAVETKPDSPANPAPGRQKPCLVVHEDLELRLKLAELVREATVNVSADTMSRTGFDRLAIDRIRAYGAVLLILEFVSRDKAADPLEAVIRLRRALPLLPLFVFARGGDERWAARAMKAGATDYWPIHSVDVGELRAALLPIVQRSQAVPAAAAPVPRPAPSEAQNPPKIAGYRLLKKIAHSTSATVYLARNDDAPQPVALKIQALKGRHGVSADDRQRFARECKILASLNHRFVADVIDFGITDDYLYLALEYFPCGSLRERLRNPVSEADAIDYARQIGEALRVVHEAGIIHRDLKPSNLMLSDDNRVVLIDFGSARTSVLSSDITSSDLRTGTPYYMCPEQISGQDPDERGDLYSLGVVMFEMLAGILPFRGSNLAEVLEAHNSARVPRLPGRMKRYQPVVDRLLAKTAADRYPSAAHFLEGLSAVSPKTTAGATDS